MSSSRRIGIVNSDGQSRPPAAAPEGVETTVYETRLRVMARSPYDLLFTELGVIETAERALRDGCDVIYLDTFGDYGLERIRSLTPLPIIGAGEASIADAAARIGDFSIVTVWPRSLRHVYDERVQNSPGGERCRGIHHFSDEDELALLGTGTGIKARMLRHEATLVEQLAALCRHAVEVDGSAGVQLGCTCMHPVARELQEAVDFPVLDATDAGVRAAFRAAQDGSDGRRDTTMPTDRPGLATEVLEAYLAAQGVDQLWLDSCEVCAVVPAG